MYSWNTFQTFEYLISGITTGVNTYCLQKEVILLARKEAAGLNLN